MEKIIFTENSNIESVIDRLSQLATRGNCVFRGYNTQKELYPNLIRDRNYSKYESSLLKEFEKYGRQYFNSNNAIDFMSCAQHFGLPTRLIDFTYNPFIALSFSLYYQKTNAKYIDTADKSYYYISFASLEKNIYVNSIYPKEDLFHGSLTRTDSLAVIACQSIDNINDLFGKNVLKRSITSLHIGGSLEKLENEQQKLKDRRILFVDPNLSNQRVIMQQGLFMFPYTLDKNEHIKIIRNNTSTIMIHKSLREDLLKYLDTLGYNAFRLMPDLSSVCTAVTRKVCKEDK